MTSLYEMSSEYLAATAKMEADGFDAETIENTLEGFGIEDKLTNCAYYVKNSEGDLAAIKAEIDRLTAAKKSKENSISRLKDYMLSSMIQTGVTIDSPTLPIKLAKCPASLGDIDESKVPDLFWVQPETPPPHIDKRGLLAAIKLEPIEGIELVDDKKRLKIG